ncbi:MAG: hypothetical protein ACH0QD_05400 [Tepidibacillus sp.]
MDKTRKLKRIIIKEELVYLTGDFKLAIVLNQMIYWSERVRDYDKFVLEEKERIEKYGDENTPEQNAILKNGWIYKKAEELSEETMIGVKPKAMREYLKTLVEHGWLDQRRNPHIAMDRTLQYRVNIVKIQKDLKKLGFNLDGYGLFEDDNEDDNSPEEKEFSKEQKENSNFLKENSKGEKENWKVVLENRKGEKEKAIPEITTEITSESFYNEEEEEDIYISEEKNIYIQAFIDEAISKKLPKSLIKDTLKHLHIRNITFSLEALRNTFDIVKKEYAKKKLDGSNKIKSFGAYFVAVLESEQARLELAATIEKEDKKDNIEFEFYNWLEEEE